MLSCYRELNSGPHPYQGCALPLSDPQLGRLVLYQLSYFRIFKWAGTDSNRRRRKPTDLQSARFNHLPTYPTCLIGGAKLGIFF